MATGTTARTRQDWAERLERDGYVEFGLSRRRLARTLLPALFLIPIGVAVVAIGADDNMWWFVGGATCAYMGAYTIYDARLPLIRGSRLRVDPTGLTIRRRQPIQVPWHEVVQVYGDGRRISLLLLPETLLRWAGDSRLRRGTRADLDDELELTLLDAPMAELASWLNAETDRRATIADANLLLAPAATSSPLAFLRTGRPLPIDRLNLDPTVADRLVAWNAGSTAGIDPSLPTEQRVTASDELTAEGAALADEIARALGANATVRLAEEAVGNPEAMLDVLNLALLSERGRGWADQLATDGVVQLIRPRRRLALTWLFAVGLGGASVAGLLSPFLVGSPEETAEPAFLGLLVLPCVLIAWFAGILPQTAGRLVVTPDGVHLHVAGQRLRLPWAGISFFDAHLIGRGGSMPMAHATRTAVRSMLAHRSFLARLAFPGWGVRRGKVLLPYSHHSETEDLVVWLDWELLRRAPLPEHLVMSPEEPAVNVYCRETERVVHLSRVPMRESTRAAVREWNRRAAPLFSMETLTLPPALADEARELAAQIQADLPAGSTMTYYEDVPEGHRNRHDEGDTP